MLSLMFPPAVRLSPTRRFVVDASKHLLERLPVKSKAGVAKADEFKKMALLIYFSAGWCPHCKDFTPKLKKFYDEAKSDGLRVLWVSKDHSADEQRAYLDTLPATWMYLPYGEENKDLYKAYNVDTIPTVKLVDGHGCVVDEKALAKIQLSVQGQHKDFGPDAPFTSSPREVLKEWRELLSHAESIPHEEARDQI